MTNRPFNSGEPVECEYCGGYGHVRGKRHAVCTTCNGTGKVYRGLEYMDNDEWLENIEERLQALEDRENNQCEH